MDTILGIDGSYIRDCLSKGSVDSRTVIKTAEAKFEELIKDFKINNKPISYKDIVTAIKDVLGAINSGNITQSKIVDMLVEIVNKL